MDQTGKISLGAAILAGLVLLSLPALAFLGSRRCRRAKPRDQAYTECLRRYPKLFEIAV